jgi:hypothetical protein
MRRLTPATAPHDARQRTTAPRRLTLIASRRAWLMPLLFPAVTVARTRAPQRRRRRVWRVCRDRRTWRVGRPTCTATIIVEQAVANGARPRCCQAPV